jgi:nitroreductase
MNDEEGCYRCQHCLAVCPTGAVSILGCNPDDSIELEGNLPEAAKVETLIKGRRSVRRYSSKHLDPKLIDELLDISWHAPTGVNAQGVLFTVIKDGNVMQKLRDEVLDRLTLIKDEGKLPDGLAGQYLGGAVKAWHESGTDIIFRGAPHLLVASAPQDCPCPVQDTLIALTTFQMIAHARGIGTVWDGMFMMILSVMPELSARIGVPDDHVIGYAMVFGEPVVEYRRTVQRGAARVNTVKL